MPADLLEKPAEVKDFSREIPKIGSVAQRSTPETSEQKPASQERTKSLWRKIFEGHEEFLGWTPE